MDPTAALDHIIDPKRLLLDMAKLRNTAGLLSLVVSRLAESPQVALARIWLVRPGDICAACRMRPECPAQTQCLHLGASAGHSSANPEADYSGLEGAFRRFPLGVRKVGRIAAIAEDSFNWLRMIADHAAAALANATPGRRSSRSGTN